MNTKGERRGGSSVKGRVGTRAYMAGTGVCITRGDAVLIAPAVPSLVLLRAHLTSRLGDSDTDQDLPIAPSQCPESQGDSVGRACGTRRTTNKGRRPVPALRIPRISL